MVCHEVLIAKAFLSHCWIRETKLNVLDHELFPEIMTNYSSLALVTISDLGHQRHAFGIIKVYD